MPQKRCCLRGGIYGINTAYRATAPKAEAERQDMATFQYTAQDSSGQEQSGTIEAENRSAAIAAIRANGLFPTGLSELSGAAAARAAASGAAAAKKKSKGKGLSVEIKLPKFLQPRIKQKELTAFTRQLATLVNAGLPLMRSLDVLKKQTKHPRLLEALDGIIESISGGATFSEALSAYPKIFDSLYVSMVKAGEAGGVLELVLKRLAEFAEKAEKIKNKVKGAMVYPIVVLVAAIGITAFLMIKVIPTFQSVFKDLLGGEDKLPAITKAVISASQFVQTQGASIFVSAVAAIVLLKMAGRTKKGAYFFDSLKLHLPAFGTLVRRTAVSRVSRTLGTLLASGVPILQALLIVRDTSGNQIVAGALQDVHDAVKEGESMTDPLAASGVFPPMVVSMVQVGEETGALSDMLTRVADTYDDEVDNAVAGMTAAIEPILILTLALIVGTIVIAMFMPMVSIIQNVGGAGGAI